VAEDSSALVKRMMLVASIMGAMAVILGAMGAHALKSHLLPEQLNSFETGVKYQLYHSLLLLLIALLGKSSLINNKSLSVLSWTIPVGIILFSWSIFLLSTRSLTGWQSLSILGPITPLGGVLLIFSWIYLGWSSFSKK
jgi:uncharacterized membrane protein YgdD (TMEM256/DUF423 family)